MRRIFLLFCLAIFTANLAAEEILDVKALHFFADENTGTIELNENVEIKKAKDTLYAKKVIIHINKTRTPTRYSAYGEVKFGITTKDNRRLSGSAEEVHYDVARGEYRLKGDGEIIEDGKPTYIRGEEIILNSDFGHINITGDAEKPARIIFDIEDPSFQKKKNGKNGDGGDNGGVLGGGGAKNGAQDSVDSAGAGDLKDSPDSPKDSLGAADSLDSRVGEDSRALGAGQKTPKNSKNSKDSHPKASKSTKDSR